MENNVFPNNVFLSVVSDEESGRQDFDNGNALYEAGNPSLRMIKGVTTFFGMLNKIFDYFSDILISVQIVGHFRCRWERDCCS